MKRHLTFRQREAREVLPPGWLWTLRYLVPDPSTGFRGRAGFDSRKTACERQAELDWRGVKTDLYQDRW